MVKREIEVPDGEMELLKILFGSTSLDEVVKEAYSKGFILDSLDMSSVEKEGPWISTKESTVVNPILILYLKEKEGKRVLISKRSNGQYCLSDYRFIP